MNDSASERDDAAPVSPETATGAPASPRRVLNPDLLWVESVTERLLGNSEPPTWERAPIGEQVTATAKPEVDEVDDADATPEPQPGTFEPAPAVDEPDPSAASQAEVSPLPVRTPRTVTRPLSYAEVLADRPPHPADRGAAARAVLRDEDRSGRAGRDRNPGAAPFRSGRGHAGGCAAGCSA